MLERIVTPRPRQATPPLVASAAVHLALALLVTGVLARAAHEALRNPPEERAMLLLPLLPSSAPPQATRLDWAGGTSPGDGPAGGLAGSGRGRGTAAGSGRRRTRVVPGALPGPTEGGSNLPVYAFDADIDRPVSRHPLAGAPEYPRELLAARIEGTIAVEFTVDTTGQADSASLVVLESTHPAFARAVRAAMPRLRFIPAEHQGHRVRQRVAQRYYFRLEIADSVRTST